MGKDRPVLVPESKKCTRCGERRALELCFPRQGMGECRTCGKVYEVRCRQGHSLPNWEDQE